MEIQVVDGDDVAEGFGDVFERDAGHAAPGEGRDFCA
jgi:hypothetical protein